MTVEEVKEEEQEETFEKGSNSWRDSLALGQESGDSNAQRVFKVVFPLALWFSSLLFAHLLMVRAGDADRWFTLSFMYLIPPLGKEIIIPMGISEGYPPLLMAFTVTFVDIWVAMIISWNYWYMEKIPKVGGLLKKTEDKGAALLAKSPAAGKGTWWAIVALGLIPFLGAGGFLGAVIGKFIGMTPIKIISAVATGAFLSGLMYAYVADALFKAFESYPWLTLIVLAILIIGFYGAYRFYKAANAITQEDEDTAKAEAV